MQITEINKITLERADKLMVRLPSDTTEEEQESVRLSLVEFFSIAPSRILIYKGDVEFQVIK